MLRNSPIARNRTLLRLECLEERRCLSAVAGLDAGTLTITGDGGADDVRIVHNDTANQIQVIHDGVTDTFTSSAVNQIVVNLRGGDDVLTEELEQGTNFFRAKDVSVNLGRGDDTLMFDLAGDASFWATLKEDLEIDARTGGGDDAVQINVPAIEIANHLDMNAHLGKGDDRFDAISYGRIGAQGRVTLDVWGEAGQDELFYYGTYDPNAPANGIVVVDQATLGVYFDGGAGKDKLGATYSGKVDGMVSFFLHGDQNDAGGAERDRVTLHTNTSAGSTGTLSGNVLGGQGDDRLELLAEGTVPADSTLVADGGQGFDKAVTTFNVSHVSIEA
jgi:hypothetical protein